MSFFSIMIWAISHGPEMVNLIVSIINLIHTVPGVTKEQLVTATAVAKATGDVSMLEKMNSQVPWGKGGYAK